ncbi:MAG TPA: hypothetical protein VG096_15290 [Bryobacteraceae bacterium]|jgi:hypothetical protein|nr:hypothetical protein [Bryobacteraceae bacterium]
MEFRIEKRTFAILTGLLFAVPAGFTQEQIQYEAWHGHSRPPHVKRAGNLGALTISLSGVSFTETYKDGEKHKHPHIWHWDYQDIEQLKLSPKALTVLTYKADKWKLGADREYEFDLLSDRTFEDAYPMLKGRLDQRFVAAIPTRPAEVLWDIPVKHLLRFGGDEGVLRIGSGEVVYSSDQNGASRTWRFEDIDNISSSGPFQLTITTFERAKTHYGSLKGFNFELKQRLDEARYNDLWLRLNQSKGLKVLSAYRQ